MTHAARYRAAAGGHADRVGESQRRFGLHIPVKGDADDGRCAHHRAVGRVGGGNDGITPVLHRFVVVIGIRVAAVVKQAGQIGRAVGGDGGDAVGEAGDRAPLLNIVVVAARVFVLDRRAVGNRQGDLPDVRAGRGLGQLGGRVAAAVVAQRRVGRAADVDAVVGGPGRHLDAEGRRHDLGLDDVRHLIRGGRGVQHRIVGFDDVVVGLAAVHRRVHIAANAGRDNRQRSRPFAARREAAEQMILGHCVIRISRGGPTDRQAVGVPINARHRRGRRSGVRTGGDGQAAGGSRADAVLVAIGPRLPAVVREAHEVIVAARRFGADAGLILIVIAGSRVIGHRLPGHIGRRRALRPLAQLRHDEVGVAVYVGDAGDIDLAVHSRVGAGYHLSDRLRVLDDRIADGEDWGGVGLVGFATLVAQAIHGAHHIVIVRAVDGGAVGVGRARCVTQQDIAAALHGAAIDIVADRAAHGGPTQAHGGVTGGRGQAGRRGRAVDNLTVVDHKDRRLQRAEGHVRQPAARCGRRVAGVQRVGEGYAVADIAGGRHLDRLGQRLVAVDDRDRQPVALAHGVGQRFGRIIGQQKGQRALAQHWVGGADAGQLAIPVEQRVIALRVVILRLTGVDVVAVRINGPREHAAVIGIVRAGQPHFVAIVDGRRPRHGHLDERGDALAGRAQRHIGGGELARLAVVLPRREAPERALGVMAVEQILEGVVGRVGVVFAQRVHTVREGGRWQVGVVLFGEAFIVYRAEQAEDSVAEAVAHSGVGLIAVGQR